MHGMVNVLERKIENGDRAKENVKRKSKAVANRWEVNIEMSNAKSMGGLPGWFGGKNKIK